MNNEQPKKENAMSQFQVDSEQMHAASACVQSSIHAIRDAVQGMYGNLHQLQTVWRGSAATQFHSIAQQWRSSQLNMEQTLQSIQQALNRASELYAQTESQATQLFAQ